MEDLLTRLQQEGGEQANLEPGNLLAREAAIELERLLGVEEDFKSLLAAAVAMKQTYPEPDIYDNTKEVRWSSYRQLMNTMDRLRKGLKEREQR